MYRYYGTYIYLSLKLQGERREGGDNPHGRYIVYSDGKKLRSNEGPRSIGYGGNSNN